MFSFALSMSLHVAEMECAARASRLGRALTSAEKSEVYAETREQALAVMDKAVFPVLPVR